MTRRFLHASSMRNVAAKIACLCGLLALALAPKLSAADDLPSGYWPIAKSQPVVEAIRRIRLAPDLSHLTPGERTAISKLMEAGRIIEDLYALQRHPQALSALADLRVLDARLGGPPATRNLLTMYRLFQGPVMSGAGNPAFLPVEPKPPGGGFYPPGISKEEIEAWLIEHPGERQAILDIRVVVRRGDADSLRDDLARLRSYPALATLHPGLEEKLTRLAGAPDRRTLYAVPYSVAYADEMLRVYTLLNDAARVVEADDGEFAKYLRNRARDLLSDDYESGDAAWTTSRFKHLNAEIGSYESYDDGLFGIKTSFALSVLVERPRETAALRAALGGLQGIENALPYSRRKQLRDDFRVGIYDVIADFGEARGGNTAAALPNESYLTRRYGRLILLRANIIQNPIVMEFVKRRWRAAVAPAHHDDFSADGELQQVVWHEIGHNLGIERTQDGRELDDALEESSNTLEELKADLVSLFAVPALLQRSYYGAKEARSHYASGVMRMLSAGLASREAPHKAMQRIQWNFFMQGGALEFDARAGTIRIHYDKIHDATGKLLQQVLELQNAGDKAAAERFIAQYSTWDESLHGALTRRLSDTDRLKHSLYEYAAIGD
jgi:hypothetical protein